MALLQPLFGLAAFVGIAWLLSSNRRAVRWRPVFAGILLQWVLAWLILKTRFGIAFFDGAQGFFLGLLGFAKEGAARVIGETSLGMPTGPAVLAAVILASVVFFSSVFSVLHHLGVVRVVVGLMARAMAKLMGTSGAESTSAAANIFVGQTEAPLLIRPYLPTMTRSEVGAIMTVGFATVAGGVFGIYVEMLNDSVTGIAGHLLAASVMSAPMGLGIAKLLFPETETPETLGSDVAQPKTGYSNVVDAAATGASDGLKLSLNIIGMLIAFLGLLAAINFLLGWATTQMGRGLDAEPVTLQSIFGWLFQPLAWLLGVPWSESAQVGSLLGTKVAVNEYVAYDMLTGMGNISERSRIIVSYALCGFANFSSIAIQVGGLGGICPDRRGEFARIGLRAMAGGALASFTTATAAAIFLELPG